MCVLCKFVSAWDNTKLDVHRLGLPVEIVYHHKFQSNFTKVAANTSSPSLGASPSTLQKESLASLALCFCAGSDFCDPPVGPIRLQNTHKL